MLYHINTPAEIPAVIEGNDKEKMDFQLIFFFKYNFADLVSFFEHSAHSKHYGHRISVLQQTLCST